MQGKGTKMNERPSIGFEGNVGVGIICLLMGFVLFKLNFSIGASNIFFAWFLLGVAVAGIIAPIVTKTRFSSRSSDIAVGSAMLLWALGIIWALWGKSIPSQVAGIGAVCMLIVAFVIVYALITRFESGRRTWILISSALCVLALGFFVYYQLVASIVPVWSITVLFLAASTLRQGLHNLLGSLIADWGQNWLLFLLPEVFTVLVLAFLSQFGYWEPYFHVTLAILALALFKVSSERAIPELEANERTKIGESNNNIVPHRFFSVIMEIYSGINFPIVVLLILITSFDLPLRLINASISSAVFQASLGSVTIIASFMILILQQMHQPDNSTSRQKYILRGLMGIAFVFISTSVVAFFALAMTPQGPNDASLPELAQISLNQILANQDMLFGLILLALYEWLFLAVPVSLIFIYGLVRDFVSRY